MNSISKNKVYNAKITIKKCQYCLKDFKIKSNDQIDKSMTYCKQCLQLTLFRNRYVSNICSIL